MNNIRYDRQQRIENWDQNKLANARVAIVGTGQLAQFTAASLAALGIGNLSIYDNRTDKENKPREPGFLDSLANGKGLESILHELNPSSNIQVIETKEQELNLGEQDLVLDLTNSPESKQRVQKYATARGIKTISASSGKTGGELYFVRPGENTSEAQLREYSEQTQGGFSSEILGGMITEEVRKALMPLKQGEEPVKNLAYNSTAEKRFAKHGDFDACPYEDLSQKRVLIVGAGALGNFVALAAALEGIGRIDVLDYDDVEAHNLNRQIMFYDAVGKPKSTALAEKIKQINPSIEVRGLQGKLDETTDYFSQNRPDLILDCVDNFATRAIANYFAIRNQIPLVSGGTNSESGQVVVYEPGETACLECKLGVERALGMALQGSKCTKQPDPSVIMTNEVVGGIMVGEALKVLDRGYGAPSPRIIKYDSNVPVRGGLVGASNACECQRPDITNWLSEVKQRYSLGE
jgi:molybdopterin-synthase adenylyltransferase